MVQNLVETDAVILAGGLGTRLRSVVKDKPKALAQVRGKPFLTYQLDQLVDLKVKRVVLCIGYLGDLVKKTYGKKYKTLDIIYSQEKTLLGTAGALKLALPKIISQQVLVLNGDSYFKTDLKKFFNWHFKKNSKASILLTKLPDTSRFGKVKVSRNGKILSFEEKGKVGQGYINAGVYLIQKSLINQIPKGKVVSLEKEIFPKWIDKDFFGYAGKGKFIDIGTPQSYQETDQFFAQRFVLLDRDGTLIHERNYLSEPDQIELIPKSKAALKKLNKLGLGLLVVTNQSGIGRGFFNEEKLEVIHKRLHQLLALEEIVLNGIYFCPHIPEDDCLCRKPKTGLVDLAITEHKFNPKESFVIGDNISDIELGKNIGAITILVRTGYGSKIEKEGLVSPDYIAQDLHEAAEIIQKLLV